MEGVDLLARLGDEGDVHRTARVRLAARDDEVGELRAVLSLPDRRDAEWLEGCPVEGDARLRVANADVDMVEDDPCPVPVAHTANVTEKR